MLKRPIKFLFVIICCTAIITSIVTFKSDWRNSSIQYLLEQYLSTNDYNFQCDTVTTKLTKKGILIAINKPIVNLHTAQSKITAPQITIDFKILKWNRFSSELEGSDIFLKNPIEDISLQHLKLQSFKHLLRAATKHKALIIKLDSASSEVQKINKLQANFITNHYNKTYSIEESNVILDDGGSINLNGLIILDQNKIMRLKLDGSINQFQLNNWRIAQQFYNSSTIRPTWKFLDEFIKSGTITEGEWSLDLNQSLLQNPSQITKDNLSGKFILNNIDLDYGSEFPVVKDINTILHLNGPKLYCEVLRAHSQNTKLKSGIIELDLTEIDPYIKTHVTATGPAADLIDFIPTESHTELKQAKLDFSKIKGQSDTDIKIIIPLDEKPNQYDIKTNTQNIALNIVDDHVVITDTNLKGHYTGDKITLVGDGVINGYKSSIEYKAKLEGETHHQVDIKFNMTKLPNPDEIIQIIDGEAQGHLQITKTDKQTDIITNIKLDDATVKIPLLGITKEKDVKSKAQLKTSFVNAQYIPVQINIDSERSLVVDLDIDYVDESWKVNINKVKDYHVNFSGALEVSDSLIKAKLEGELLDLADINLNKMIKKKAPNIDPSNEATDIAQTTPRNIDIDVKLRQTKMKNNIWLDDVILSLKCSPTACERGYLNANVGTREISVIREENTPGIEEWRVFSDNAGALLQAVGIYESLKSGNLLLVLKRHYLKPQEPISGNFVLREFVTVDTNFLTRMVSFISLPGLMGAITNNDNISFKEMQGLFNWENGNINIKHIGAEGPYFDFTLKGKVDTASRNIDLTGTISPSLYGISTIVRNIPIIGTIFSGGRRKGLFFAPFRFKEEY